MDNDSKTVKNTEEFIKNLGFPLPKKLPPDGVTWPQNIADLSSDELAEHLSWWSGWSSYTRWHLAKAETNYSVAEKKLTIETAKRLYTRKSEFKTVAEAKNAVLQEEEVQKLEVDALQKDALRSMLKALLDGYESKYSTISREITRRNNDVDQNKPRNGWKVRD
jgi:hypothetical protein